MMYGRELALIHDEGFKDFSEHAFQELKRIINLERNHTITDLGCGSGDFLKQFLNKNNKLIGVDISETMIRLARLKIPSAELKVDSIYKCKIEPSTVITAIGEVLNYRDAAESGDEHDALFESVYSMLRPDGIFMFDVMLESDVLDRTYEKIHDTDNWTVLLDSQEDKERKMVKRRIITFYKEGAAYIKNEEIHYLKLYSEEELKRMLHQIGFNITVMDHYNGFPLERGRKAFVCRKE